MFHLIVGDCIQSSLGSKPTLAVGSYGTSALHVSSLSMLFIFAESEHFVLKRTLRVRFDKLKVIQ